MGENSAIEWTHATFNPWWGCTNVSPACDHCYAETLSRRYGHDVWGRSSERRLFGPKHWNEPLRWDRQAAAAGERRRVFCASMADVFEDHTAVTDERRRLWDLVEATPNLDWLLLTKRPQNVLRMVPRLWREDFSEDRVLGAHWPSNVWVGTSVENQRYAQLRIPQLLEIPAPVRFLSCEPLLGPVDLNERGGWLAEIGWVIAGGESGHGARPMHPDWPRRLRDQCAAAEVPFLFKQWGEHYHAPINVTTSDVIRRGVVVDPDGAHRPASHGLLPPMACLVLRVGKKVAGRTLDGRTWDEYPKP